MQRDREWSPALVSSVEDVLDRALQEADDMLDFVKIGDQGNLAAEHGFAIHLNVVGEKQPIAVAKQFEPRTTGFAKKQRAAGLPLLYNLASTRLWSILEAHVGHCIQLILEGDPASRNTDAVRAAENKLGRFDAIPSADRDGFMQRLASTSGAKKKHGVDRFEALWGATDLGEDATSPFKKPFPGILLELEKVRHRLVHADGKPTADFRKDFPGFRYSGTDGRISCCEPLFHAYFFATVWYIGETASRLRVKVNMSEGYKHTIEENAETTHALAHGVREA